MNLLRFPLGRLLTAVLLPALAGQLLPTGAQAGPLIRRAQERQACQEFASKLQQASANPAMAQQVYQQGVLALVSRFGENPCTDIPAPVATGAPATPAAAPTATPATPAAVPAATPAVSPTAAGTATPVVTAPAPSSQQQQACQQFASKLQAAAASGGAAAAQQTYAMGVQKLSGMFGPDPCPAIQPPQ